MTLCDILSPRVMKWPCLKPPPVSMKRWRMKNEKNDAPSTAIRSATPHHHPLPVEGRPQPICLRSVARTARKPPRPARRAPRTAMPAGSLTCAGRVGSSRRRALRYGRWAATFPSLSTGGGGVWHLLATLSAGVGSTTEPLGRRVRPRSRHVPDAARSPTRELAAHPAPPPPAAANQGPTAPCPPPLRRAHGASAPPSCAGGQPHGRAPLRPRLRRRLGSARCAVCSRQGGLSLLPPLSRGLM